MDLKENRVLQVSRDQLEQSDLKVLKDLKVFKVNRVYEVKQDRKANKVQ